MPESPIDEYLARIDDPVARRALSTLRAQPRALLPDAVEVISYRMPAFRVAGGVAAGFGFFGKNCGYYAFSGSVVPALKDELAGYTTSKSGVTFPPDEPLPAPLVAKLVARRLAEISASGQRITDSAVKQATGRDWRAWMRALDAAGGAALTHKELVAVAAREVSSTWWQQSVAVTYEKARGKRVLGETAAGRFQVGVVRTLPMTAAAFWELLGAEPSRWLGAGARFALEAGTSFSVPKRRGAPAVRGEIRTVKARERVRMTWRPQGWDEPAILQITLLSKKDRVAVTFHMEKLPSAEVREAMRARWAEVLGRVGGEAAARVR